MSNDYDLTLKEMVELIDDDGVNLTDWEIEFIDSMLKQFDRPNFKPTDKQKETIIKIYKNKI
jgi:hypothetical protein